MIKVLILGGGIAGVEASIRAKKAGFDVTLISERDYLYIYPLSIWIPTKEISFEDTTMKLDELAEIHGFNLIIDEVKEIKAKEQRVLLSNKEIDFEYLIIALGAGNKSLKGIENTLSICSKPEEAVGLCNLFENFLEKKEGVLSFGFGGNPKDSSTVRGGPAFELMFNINTLLKQRGIRDNFTINFFAPMDKVGSKMGEGAVKNLQKFFKKENINVYTGKKIDSFVSDGIIFEDSTKLDSEYTMFIPAKTGHLVVKNSDLPTSEDGFIETDEYSLVKGFENIYAIGDVANLQGPSWRAKQGHIAEVMAENAVFNIENPENRKSYIKHINILCLMDTRDGAILVYRDLKRSLMIPLFGFGHLLKKLWGKYFKLTKLGKFPKII